MSDTPDTQGALTPDSALPEIPHKGTLWKVGRPDQDARARLEKLAKAVAINEIRELKGVLDPDAYREAFNNVARNLSHYGTWGEGWQTVVFGHPHLFLWSLLQAHHPAVSESQVKQLATECPEEVEFALAQVIPDFFAMLLAELKPRVPPDLWARTEQEVRAALDELRRPGPTRTAAPKS